ncbi:MAG: helix-turn-helix domain-containing protein [Kofleriaceae bacterium]
MELQSEPTPAETPRVPSLDEVIRDHILHVLRICEGQKTRTSRLLGIDRSTLWKKLRDYGVE